jgi:hypothetical protein
MTLPNFLVIGAGKSGTTSLWRYLGQHPDVYVSPVKEPNFFALEGKSLDFGAPKNMTRNINSWSVTNLGAYRDLFNEVSGEKAIGEASPLYLYFPDAPGRIRHYIPDVRLIAILRNPVERAYSAFTHLVHHNVEPFTDFARALQEEEARIEANWEWTWHYKRAGFYYEQLSRHYETFDREQIRVYLYEDLCDDPIGLLRDLFGFIGVDEAFAGTLPADALTKHKASRFPRSRALHHFLRYPNPFKSVLKPFLPEGLRRTATKQLWSWNFAKPPALSLKIRQDLTALYHEDIEKLQDLIGRDLSRWLR